MKLFAYGSNVLSFNLQSASHFNPVASFYDLELDVGSSSLPSVISSQEISWTSGKADSNIGFDGPAGSVNTPFANLGNIFPAGLDLSGLQAMLTNNAWDGPNSEGGQFDLIVDVVPTDPPLIPQLNSPSGIVFAPDGQLYVAHEAFSGWYPDGITRYNGSNGEFGEIFSENFVNEPNTLLLGSDGKIYLGSEGFGVVRYDVTTGDADVFAASGKSVLGISFGPEGDLYVSLAEGSIERYDGITGSFVEVFASGDGLIVPSASVFVSDPGDTDGDLDVDTADLTVMFQNFTGAGGMGKTMMQGDTDMDGDVDTADITVGFQNFTGAQAGLASVPEPSAWVLLVLGSAGLALVRRWRARRR